MIIYIYIHIICTCMTIDIPRYIMELTCVMMYGYIKYLYLNGFINKLTAGGPRCRKASIVAIS